MNQLDCCKIVDTSYPTINMAFIIYKKNLCVAQCGSACLCARQYEHHSTLPHLLPFMIL